MLIAASCRPVSPAVLTVNTSRPRKGRRSAAVFTAAERRRERAFLLRHTPRPRTWAPRRILDQLGRHRELGMRFAGLGHGIGHEHQALVGMLRPEFDQEIAHRIAPPWQAERLHQRHHHLLGDEAFAPAARARSVRSGDWDGGRRHASTRRCLLSGRPNVRSLRSPSWLPVAESACHPRRRLYRRRGRRKARPRRGPRTIPPWRPAPRARSGRACAHRARAASIRHRNAGSRSYADRARR